MKPGDIVVRSRLRQVNDNRIVYPDARVWNIPMRVESVFVCEGKTFAACRAPTSDLLEGSRSRDPVVLAADLVPFDSKSKPCEIGKEPPWNR